MERRGQIFIFSNLKLSLLKGLVEKPLNLTYFKAAIGRIHSQVTFMQYSVKISYFCFMLNL